MTRYQLPAVPAVDAVGVEARARTLAARSLKTSAKRRALELAIRTIDLTTLEGADTAERVRRLCARAARPDPSDASVPPVAAVCVYPALVATAVRALAGSPVRVASVAAAFPSGQSFLATKLDEVQRAVEAGAHEIDVVISRGALLAGEHARAFDEVAALKEACGCAHLKVILETGELGSYDAVRRAARIAMDAGADFVKTSTGKIQSAATLPVVLVMLEAVSDFQRETGRAVGVKAAGGIRTAKSAWQYLVLANETLGPAWLSPERFRLGASSLLDDLLLQWRRLATGRYESTDDLPES